MALRAVQNLSLADQVFEQLGAEIMSGRLGPGASLPSERKLVETFEVNRHVVREALKRLQQIGLIKVSQGGGAKVLDFERDAGLDLLALLAEHASVREDAMRYWIAVHEMRAAIGTDIARLCALRASPELKAEILEIAQRMRELGDGPELFALELRFWDRLQAGAGNIAYRLAFNTLLRAISTPSIAELARELSIQEVKQSDYRVPIAEAIAAGSAELAETRMRQSLRGLVEGSSASTTPAPAPVPAPETAAGSSAGALRKSRKR
jgi:GntR family transcriptional regulator, transcriptional repressor for pyruvate dehydrogenase complex